MPHLGLYVHFPFCSVRCSYCDFATVAGRDPAIPRYLTALRREITSFQPELPQSVDTLFIGGGTPSRMEPAQLAQVMAAIRSRFRLVPECEITIECNPEDVSTERLHGFVDVGVNRVSIGVQSLDAAVLSAVGRAHDGDQALEALARARKVPEIQVSADLIAGLPGEPLGAWSHTVTRVIDAAPDHVSCYLLETDKNSPLARGVRSGRIPLSDPAVQAEAYEAMVQLLERRGYQQYEISNFAQPGKRCRHNLKYWDDAPFAGFGVGAYGYVGDTRRANQRSLDAYLSAVEGGQDPLDWSECLSDDRRLEDALIFGLRRVDGVDLAQLGERYSGNLLQRFAQTWDAAEARGLLERHGSRVRLTSFGRLHSNELFQDLIT